MMVGTNRRVSSRIALCAALVSGMVFSSGASALAGCAEQVWVEVYEVEVEAERDSYRPGDTAALEATVVNQETKAPIENANVVAYVTNLKKGWIYGMGKTDAAGKATARLKLKKGSVRPGPVEVQTVAYRDSVDTTCARVVEYGDKRLKKAFVVKRSG